jgi:hypothetical protein
LKYSAQSLVCTECGIGGRWSVLPCGISAILFQSYIELYLFIYLFVIVAEWSVAITALVLRVGYDLAGRTQNMTFSFARFEVFTVVLLKVQVFWDVMRCQQVNSCHFRGVIAVM